MLYACGEKTNCINNVKRSDKVVLFIFTDIIGKNQSKDSVQERIKKEGAQYPASERVTLY